MARGIGAKAAVALTAFVMVGCSGEPTSTANPAITLPPIAAPSPTVAQPTPDPTDDIEAYRASVLAILARIDQQWTGFCFPRGRPENEMPPPAILAGLDTSTALRDSADELLNLPVPPRGWLEIHNLAQDIGAEVNAVILADILIRVALRDGGVPDPAEWMTEIIEPCNSTISDIRRLREAIDKQP